MKGIGFVIVGVSVLGMGLLTATLRRRNRVRASAVPPDQVLREARGIPARVFVDRDVLGGPQARRTNRSKADLVLTQGRLLVATHHGRVLELTPPHPGSVRCTGPKRLVLEGNRLRKEGLLKVRVELICHDAEAWVDLAERELGASRSVTLLGN